jgi:hypothetical protein
MNGRPHSSAATLQGCEAYGLKEIVMENELMIKVIVTDLDKPMDLGFGFQQTDAMAEPRARLHTRVS